MKKTLALAAAGFCVFAARAARAGNGAPLTPSTDPITIAVFGDWPYSSTLLENAPLLVNSINADPKVRLVLHVGDIHSGSMPCTGAQLDPTPAGSVPGWNVGIYNIFQQMKDPVVYTRGTTSGPIAISRKSRAADIRSTSWPRSATCSSRRPA